MKSNLLSFFALVFMLNFAFVSCKKADEPKDTLAGSLVGKWKPHYEEEMDYNEDEARYEYTKTYREEDNEEVLSFDATGFMEYRDGSFADTSHYWTNRDTVFTMIPESGEYIRYAQFFSVSGDTLKLRDGPYEPNTYYYITTFSRIK